MTSGTLLGEVFARVWASTSTFHFIWKNIQKWSKNHPKMTPKSFKKSFQKGSKKVMKKHIKIWSKKLAQGSPKWAQNPSKNHPEAIPKPSWTPVGRPGAPGSPKWSKILPKITKNDYQKHEKHHKNCAKTIGKTKAGSEQHKASWVELCEGVSCHSSFFSFVSSYARQGKESQLRGKPS